MNLLVFLSSLTLGLRHGLDYDHIAAITDITGSINSSNSKVIQTNRLAFHYVFGHVFMATIN